MSNQPVTSAESSPWLISFEESLAERLHSPVVENGYGLSPRNGTPRNGVLTVPASGNTPTAPNMPGIPTPSVPEEDNVTRRRFFAIAARAYQEAVKFPEEPPPSLWTPSTGCHSYYDSILYKFAICFQTILERQGRFNRPLFEAEWVRHCRSILDNIRAEWGRHPIGSTAAIKTTISTPNSPVAVLALEYVIGKPTSPPPDGWAVGDQLHPYYEMMLARFDGHLRALLREYGMSLFHQPIDIHAAINQFTVLIIQEYRRMWIAMYGL